MPLRRPLRVGFNLGSALLIVLLVVSRVSTAAQQQQSVRNIRDRSPRDEGHAHTVLSRRHGKPSHDGLENNANARQYTSLLAQDKSAVVTQVSSTPAVSAVRAFSSRNAASPPGLSRRSARSIDDWEVEDFVLLATVDGKLQARDRYSGTYIWEIDIERPMVETIYNTKNDSDDLNGWQNKPFIWIVEPKEDGALYILSPGPYPVLQNLGMTVKQLADDISLYSSDDPPVVYTANKNSVIMVVDARSGTIVKSFSANGAVTNKFLRQCDSHASELFRTKDQECRGFIYVGQVQYTISIHQRETNEHLCTIKYNEWTPNNRDRDLQGQHQQSMDHHYIYSRYDGHAIAYDHRRTKWSKRPVFERKLSYPIARVFDVARMRGDNGPEPSLVLLPQPPGLARLEEKARNVWLNTTETGGWYALSEVNYPAVTDSAPEAMCYNREYNDLPDWEGSHKLPDRRSLVGVHRLDHNMEYPPPVRQIEAPTHSAAVNHGDRVPSIPPGTLVESDDLAPAANEIFSHNVYWIALVMVCIALVSTAVTYKGWSLFDHPKKLQPSPATNPTSEKLMNAAPAPSHPDPSALEGTAAEGPKDLPAVEVKAVEEAVKALSTGVEPTTTPEPKEKEKKVTFDIHDDEEEEEEDLTLSRTTTAEQPSPPKDSDTHVSPAGPEDPSHLAANQVDGLSEDQAASPATPVKKKKTHRGKRGGQKGKNKKAKVRDEVDHIVDAAKQLHRTPTLHPDEMTINGDDMQDVCNIKKIGKLTIDFDRILGNGSGGTFVFEGKWNDRDVAIKRMLPQYFGLAEQEVKLLRDSEPHPNVIRYFDDEKDENFLYIAVELCQASLFDLFDKEAPKDERTDLLTSLVEELDRDRVQLLYQLIQGLEHLHHLRIVHRDIKPQNILIACPRLPKATYPKQYPRVVISDFGLCKTLPDNGSTLISTTWNAGTVGWKAPELILQPKDIGMGSFTGHSRESSNSTDPVSQGVKRAVDIFSLGCVFFYVLTNGLHPFDHREGWAGMRELKIKKNQKDLNKLRLLDDSEEAIHLISWMLSNHPEDRPTAPQVRIHPFFWDAEIRLSFLCDCSDYWEREPRDPPSQHLSNLEGYAGEVLGKKQNFLAKLDKVFVASLGKQRKYQGDRMLDLLRALRNKKNHYEDMEEDVKAKVGSLPHGYLRYWTTKFPRLLISCYEAVIEGGLHREERFRAYYDEALPR